MTGGEVYITDSSTASRTMLFNLHTNQWDDEILDIIGIPKSILPEIKDNAEIYGHTSKDFISAKIPIAGSVVDQSAALFGQACFSKGSVKTTYGTGCFMLMNTGDKPIVSKNGLITTAVWSIDKKVTFALDGGVYIGGAAYLGALGIGDIDSVDAINSNWKLSKRYFSSISEDQRKTMMEQWKKAIGRSTNWIDPNE